MKTKTKFNRILIFGILLILLISIFFNILLIKENKRYEENLSQEIENTLKPMGSSINTANAILEEIIKNNSTHYYFDIYYYFNELNKKMKEKDYSLTNDKWIDVVKSISNIGPYLID